MLTLAPRELSELTGKRRGDAQARVLSHMGIPFTTRPDCTLAVLRAVVERALGGMPGTIERPEPQLMP
jgi:hypothetical protein